MVSLLLKAYKKLFLTFKLSFIAKIKKFGHKIKFVTICYFSLQNKICNKYIIFGHKIHKIKQYIKFVKHSRLAQN